MTLVALIRDAAVVGRIMATALGHWPSLGGLICQAAEATVSSTEP